jgi:uronate dehydrogenase
VSPELPPRPDSLYGVFKVWGETMLRNYHDRHDIRSVSLRIGTYRPEPIDQRSLATWLSQRDVAHLVDVSLRHPDPGRMVVNGYSNNTRLKTHDPNWVTLGYQPRDNAEDFARSSVPSEWTWMRRIVRNGNGRNMAARPHAPSEHPPR